MSRLWASAGRWLEAGSRGAAERRRKPEAEGGELPWQPGSVAVMEAEPTIDLHHFHPRDVPSLVDEYVRAAHEAGLAEVLIIHGRGKGVQRSVVARVLAKHPLVERFGAGSGAAGQGATVAQLRPPKTQHKTKTSRPI